jgi:hypothetical protein
VSFVDDDRADEWRACPHCGTRVQRVARRCLTCHRDLEEVPPVPEGPPESRAAAQSRPLGGHGAWLTLSLVIASVVFGGACFAGFLLWLGIFLAPFVSGS